MKPHAAATSGSVRALSSFSMASGARVVSASMAMVQGVSTKVSAKFWAPALDPVFFSGRITSAPASSASSPVRSVDPSSTTMTRPGGVVWERTLRTVSATEASSL